jgi:predicted nucleotidyltransferase
MQLQTSGIGSERVACAAGEAIGALEEARIPYVLIGGLASSILGRPRSTEDVDFLVKKQDATRVLDTLAGVGFQTERTNPLWIFKAYKHGVVIDVIFWLMGDIALDEEMLARARHGELGGHPVSVASPEDLIVVKAIVADEQTPRHWHDALGIVADQELDWDYLAQRARHGIRRVLALLVYAQSNDLVVPEEAIRTLFEAAYGNGR